MSVAARPSISTFMSLDADVTGTSGANAIVNIMITTMTDDIFTFH